MTVVFVLSCMTGCDQGIVGKPKPSSPAATAPAPAPTGLAPFTAKAWDVIEPVLMVRRTPADAPAKP